MIFSISWMDFNWFLNWFRRKSIVYYFVSCSHNAHLRRHNKSFFESSRRVVIFPWDRKAKCSIHWRRKKNVFTLRNVILTSAAFELWWESSSAGKITIISLHLSPHLSPRRLNERCKNSCTCWLKFLRAKSDDSCGALHNIFSLRQRFFCVKHLYCISNAAHRKSH